MFLNQKQLRQDIADIVMGELTRSGSKQVKGRWHLSAQHHRTADSEEHCAALALSDRVAEEIIMRYILIEPEED